MQGKEGEGVRRNGIFFCVCVKGMEGRGSEGEGKGVMKGKERVGGYEGESKGGKSKGKEGEGSLRGGKGRGWF